MSDWHLEDHVCRRCFGRLVSKPAHGGHRLYRCTNCGFEAEGGCSSVVCACGLKTKQGKDLGVRCVPNDQRSAEAPSEIVARQVSS